MDVVGDLFARDRRSETTALEDATGRAYDYHWLCTSAWKAGNYLRHPGVREGVVVGVVGDGPLALLAFFGTALLGGTTWFDPPRDLAADDDVRAVVAPVERLGAYDLPRGSQRVGYGARPDEPDVHHFDAGLWSENPSFPPLEVDAETSLLAAGESETPAATVTNGEAMSAARAVADAFGVESGTRVAVEASLADPRAVVAGVLAPLLVGGAIVLGPDGRADAVVTDDARSTDVAPIPLASVPLDGG